MKMLQKSTVALLVIAVFLNVLPLKSQPCPVSKVDKTTFAYGTASAAIQPLIFHSSVASCNSPVVTTTKKAILYAVVNLNGPFLNLTTNHLVSLTVNAYSSCAGTSGLVGTPIVLPVLQITPNNPQAYVSVDFTANSPLINRFEIIPTYSYSGPLNSQAQGAITVDVFYKEEVQYQVPTIGTPIITAQSVSFNGPEATFNWTTSTCPQIPNYQFQLLRLFNNDPTKTTEANIVAAIDWNKALNIETGSSQQNISLTLAEGVGYYLWRVRPIGNAYPGGIANDLNWGAWSSTGTYAQGNTAAPVTGEQAPYLISNFATLIPGSSPAAYDFSRQLDDNKNWIFTRTFIEGGTINQDGTNIAVHDDKNPVTIGEAISYANGLQMVQQQQTRLKTEQKKLVGQTIYDYSGRPALTTLAAPVNSNQLGFISSYIKNALPTPTSYSAVDFDENGNYFNPSKVDSTSSIGPGNYYSIAPTKACPEENVPTASGYPYSRTQYMRDGTSKPKEQTAPGAQFQLNGGHTTRNYTSSVADAELISIFGDEAPAANSVLKSITIDANGEASISYISKEGKTIATCLSNTNPAGGGASNLDALPLVTDASTITQKVVNNSPYGTNGMRSFTNIVLTEQTDLVLNYNITANTFGDNCIPFCATCDYKVTFNIIDNDNPDVSFSHTGVVNGVSGIFLPVTIPVPPTRNTTGCSPSVQPPYALTIPLLPAGSYTIERIIEANQVNTGTAPAGTTANTPYIDQYLQEAETGLYSKYNSATVTATVINTAGATISTIPNINISAVNSKLYATPPDISGLYSLLGVPLNIPASSPQPDYVNLTFTQISGCTDPVQKVIKIDISQCPDNSCPVGNDFEGYFINVYHTNHPDEPLSSITISKILPYSTGEFNQVIANMIAAPVTNGQGIVTCGGYTCSDLFKCWQGVVASYETFKTGAPIYSTIPAQQIINGITINTGNPNSTNFLDLFLSCAGYHIVGVNNSPGGSGCSSLGYKFHPYAYYKYTTGATGNACEPCQKTMYATINGNLTGYSAAYENNPDAFANYYLNTSSANYHASAPISTANQSINGASIAATINPQKSFFDCIKHCPGVNTVYGAYNDYQEPQDFATKLTANCSNSCEDRYDEFLKQLIDADKKFNATSNCNPNTNEQIGAYAKIFDNNGQVVVANEVIVPQQIYPGAEFNVTMRLTFYQDYNLLNANLFSQNHTLNTISSNFTLVSGNMNYTFDVGGAVATAGTVYTNVYRVKAPNVLTPSTGNIVIAGVAIKNNSSTTNSSISSSASTFQLMCPSACLNSGGGSGGTDVCPSNIADGVDLANVVAPNTAAYFLNLYNQDQVLISVKGPTAIGSYQEFDITVTADPGQNGFFYGENLNYNIALLNGFTLISYTHDPYNNYSGNPAPGDVLIGIGHQGLNTNQPIVDVFRLKAPKNLSCTNAVNFMNFDAAISSCSYDGTDNIKIPYKPPVVNGPGGGANPGQATTLPADIQDLYCQAEAMVQACKGLCAVTKLTSGTGQLSVGTVTEQQNIVNIMGAGFFDIQHEDCNGSCPPGYSITNNPPATTPQMYLNTVTNELENERTNAHTGGFSWNLAAYLQNTLQVGNLICSGSSNVLVDPNIPSYFEYTTSGGQTFLNYNFNKTPNNTSALKPKKIYALQSAPLTAGASHAVHFNTTTTNVLLGDALKNDIGNGAYLVTTSDAISSNSVITELNQYYKSLLDLGQDAALALQTTLVEYTLDASGTPAYFNWAACNFANAPSPACQSVCYKLKPALAAVQNSTDDKVSTADDIVQMNYKTCAEETALEISNSMGQQIASMVQVELNALKQQYHTRCIDQLTDNFTVSYSVKYHHYTLYYYDRAGNLVKTIPPQGVNPGGVATIPTTRNSSTSHAFITEYEYNSLGQLVRQKTPDGGETYFYYDSKARLRFSQNAKQLVSTTNLSLNKLSYTKYDGLGRITEVGEMAYDNAFLTNINNVSGYPAAVSSNGTNVNGIHDITITNYTTPPAATISYFGLSAPRYLQNRVSSAISDKDGDQNTTADRVATYYSYDPHGNVQWLIQDIPGAGKNFIGYDYDLISGSVLKVKYNEYLPDKFFHRYTYDIDKRLKTVETSNDDMFWEKDANYNYYLHGPLKRSVVGNDKVQGLDYVYTLQGWLKAINHIAFANDPGHDGVSAGSATASVARDAYSMMLGYYQGDFVSGISGTANSAFNSSPSNTSYLAAQTGKDLFNGNISTWASNYDYSAFPSGQNFASHQNVTGRTFRYDELNRITDASFYDNTTGTWGTNPSPDYHETFVYDANGNITGLTRNSYNAASASGGMDNLNYHYNYQTSSVLGDWKNRLQDVQDIMTTNSETSDIKTQPAGNYGYDAIGNLTSDALSNIGNITWNVYGKIASITKTTAGGGDVLTFLYDASGRRVAKKITHTNNNYTTTYHVPDASGNVMATYQEDLIAPATQPTYKLIEVPVYGSDRLGMKNVIKTVIPNDNSVIPPPSPAPVSAVTIVHSGTFNHIISSVDATLYLPVFSSNPLGFSFGLAPARVSFAAELNTQPPFAPSPPNFPIPNGIVDGIMGTNTAVYEDNNGNPIIRAYVMQQYHGTQNVTLIYDAQGNLFDTRGIENNAMAQSVFVRNPAYTNQLYYFTIGASDYQPRYHVFDLSDPNNPVTLSKNNRLDVSSGYLYYPVMALLEDRTSSTNNSQLYLKCLTTLATDVNGNYASQMVRCEINKTTGVVSNAVKLTGSALPTNGAYCGEIQISPDGNTLAIANNYGKSNMFGINTGFINLYNLSPDHRSISGVPYSSIQVGSSNVAAKSFDFTTDGKALFYETLGLSNPSIKRAFVNADGSLTPDNSTVPFVGSIRRGKNGNIYIASLTYTPHHVLEIPNPSLPNYDISNMIDVNPIPDVTSPLFTYTLSGGLSIHRHLVYDQSITPAPVAPIVSTLTQRTLGGKTYELKDHLGNVHVVVSDLKKAIDSDNNGTTDYYRADVVSATDYYAFGAPMPGRIAPIQTSSDNTSAGTRPYRYGFNGQESDFEVNNIGGTSNTAEFWQYDTRLGRRWNRDPLEYKFPWQSPYCAFDNRPIDTQDPLGATGNSTHTDKKGNVLAVYDDGDLGVYMHKDAKTKEDIDKTYDSKTNRSAGGLKMGNTLMWNSFTTRGIDNTPAGRISFGSFDARNWIDRMEAKINSYVDAEGNYLARMDYAAAAGNGDDFDYKTNGLNENATPAERSQHLYRGSQISKGIYVSARDVGNYFAGSAARLTNQGKMDFMLTAGGFQLSGNSKAGILFRTEHWKMQAARAGWPAYGEASASNFFQRLGYENVRTLQGMKLNEVRIWDRKLTK